MEHLEKVEKLRERANVSYEDAKEALEASEWDLLDAMVYLERAGKVNAPEQESYSTDYEEQAQYVSVKEKVEEQEKEPVEGFFQKLGRICGILWEKSKANYFCIVRKGKEILQVPVWAFVLALLLVWQVVIPAMIMGLFLECQYSFRGKDDLDGVNKAMEKASEFADKVKDEYNKL